MKNVIILKKIFALAAPFIQNWHKESLRIAEKDLSRARDGYMEIPPTPWSIHPLTQPVGNDYVEYLENKCDKLKSKIKALNNHI